MSTSFNNAEALGQLELVANGLDPFEEDSPGHKFGLPALPVPSRMHMKHRYEPVVAQITKLLMRDGKLSKAQRVSLSSSLQILERPLLLTHDFSTGYGPDTELPTNLLAAESQSGTTPCSRRTTSISSSSQPGHVPYSRD